MIALETGIIVTRSTSDENLSSEVYRQLMLFPKTLGIVVVALMVMLLLPGLPMLPLLVLIILFMLAWWFARSS